jgi:hypothetical protein
VQKYGKKSEPPNDLKKNLGENKGKNNQTSK